MGIKVYITFGIQNIRKKIFVLALIRFESDAALSS